MTLRGKFNLMLLLVFGMALGVSGYFSYKQLTENARDEVLSNAGVLMETILSARTWAVNEVGPNLRETSEEEEMLMMGVWYVHSACVTPQWPTRRWAAALARQSSSLVAAMHGVTSACPATWRSASPTREC